MEAWGTSRMAKRTWGSNWSQFFPSASMLFLSIRLMVWLNRSTSPSVCGWYTEVRSWETCSSFSSSLTTRDMKHEP